MKVRYINYAGAIVALIAPLMKEIGGEFIPFTGETVTVLEKWNLKSEKVTETDATIQGAMWQSKTRTILLPYHGIQKLLPIERFDFTISRWGDFPEKLPHVQAGVLALDRFFEGNIPSKKELLEPLGLEPSRFTIVYALTWKERNDASSSMRKMESWINRLPPEVNLIIINHPLYKLTERFGERLESMIKQRSGSRIISNQKDTFEWLNIADLIICDSGSSIILSTPCFKAPVLQIKYPYRHRSGYDQPWALDYDYSWATEVEPEEIPDNIFTSFMGDRKSAIEKYLYKLDGKATERAVEGVKGFLEK